MSVALEGGVVESGLDVFAVVGKATALERTYPVAVTDGILNIVITKTAGRYAAMVATLDIR